MCVHSTLSINHCNCILLRIAVALNDWFIVFSILTKVSPTLSLSDELVIQKERYKSITDELDQTFTEMSGYWAVHPDESTKLPLLLPLVHNFSALNRHHNQHDHHYHRDRCSTTCHLLITPLLPLVTSWWGHGYLTCAIAWTKAHPSTLTSASTSAGDLHTMVQLYQH